MMSRRAMWAIVAILAPFTAGCATLVAKDGWKEPYAPYDGVGVDAGFIKQGARAVTDFNDEALNDRRLLLVALAMLSVIDLPMSAVADTILLPKALSNRRR